MSTVVRLIVVFLCLQMQSTFAATLDQSLYKFFSQIAQERGEKGASVDNSRAVQGSLRPQVGFFTSRDSLSSRLGDDNSRLGTGIFYESGLQEAEVAGLSVVANLRVLQSTTSQYVSPFDGSDISWGGQSGQIYISHRSRNWGPSWVGSLIMDSAAPSMLSVGVRRPVALQSRTPWLSWMGPWAADLFLGELDGHSQPRDPYLMGMRLMFAPYPTLEFGLSRVMQIGGSGRTMNLRTVWNALKGSDNTGVEGITGANQPGNQLAGFDGRWRFYAPDGYSASVYGQFIGEDSVTDGPVNYPKNYLMQVGLDLGRNSGSGPWRSFFELTDTQAQNRPGVAYVHSVYRQGYTNRGLSLGFPLGGDVQLASLGVVGKTRVLSGLIAAHVGRLRDSSQFYDAGNIRVLQAGISKKIWGLELQLSSVYVSDEVRSTKSLQTSVTLPY